MTARHSLVTALTFACFAFLNGCAALVRGTQETVQVVTRPSGATVWYQGRAVRDGEYVVVQKHLEPPKIDVGGEGAPILVTMSYDPDPWLIADAAWLIVYVVPGLVALGADFAMGTWRNLHDVQVVYVPERAREQSAEETEGE